MLFIPDLPVLTAFTLIALVIIIAPGPDMTFFLAKTMAQGRRSGFAAYLGATFGLLIHTVLVTFGLSALLAASETAFFALKMAGAVYLLWLAYDAIRNGSALRLNGASIPEQPLGEIFMMGVGINLLNPKIVLFFMTFLPQFIDVSDPHGASKLAFLGLYFIVLALPVCSLIILAAGSVAQAIRRNPRLTRVIDWLFGSVLAAFAVRLLLEPQKT